MHTITGQTLIEWDDDLQRIGRFEPGSINVDELAGLPVRQQSDDRFTVGHVTAGRATDRGIEVDLETLEPLPERSRLTFTYQAQQSTWTDPANIETRTIHRARLHSVIVVSPDA